jgi:transposase, IS5 family
VPDAKTLARIAQALGSEVIAKLHGRLVAIAQQKGAVRGRKMRVDTTVVETINSKSADSAQ